MRIKVVRELVKHDLYYALKSARGVLFLVFFAVFWLWIFSKFGRVNTQWLSNPDGAFILSWFFEKETAQALFQDKNPAFSLFYLIAINTIPLFVLFAASDQTANDIGSKYLRFLLPRCQRIEIYVGRFIGCVLLVWLAYFLISVVAAIWVVIFNQASLTEIVGEWLWVMLSLAVYVLPFIALMSLCSALVGSSGLSALLGLGAYLLVMLAVGVISFELPGVADVVGLVLPNAIKPWILMLDVGHWLLSVLAAAVYVAVFGYLGWLVFSRRDI